MKNSHLHHRAMMSKVYSSPKTIKRKYLNHSTILRSSIHNLSIKNNSISPNHSPSNIIHRRRKRKSSPVNVVQRKTRAVNHRRERNIDRNLSQIGKKVRNQIKERVNRSQRLKQKRNGLYNRARRNTPRINNSALKDNSSSFELKNTLSKLVKETSASRETNKFGIGSRNLLKSIEQSTMSRYNFKKTKDFGIGSQNNCTPIEFESPLNSNKLIQKGLMNRKMSQKFENGIQKRIEFDQKYRSLANRQSILQIINNERQELMGKKKCPNVKNIKVDLVELMKQSEPKKLISIEINECKISSKIKDKNLNLIDGHSGRKAKPEFSSFNAARYKSTVNAKKILAVEKEKESNTERTKPSKSKDRFLGRNQLFGGSFDGLKESVKEFSIKHMASKHIKERSKKVSNGLIFGNSGSCFLITTKD